MFFDKINLYLENKDTGKLKIKFICEDCKVEMDKPFYYYFRSCAWGKNPPGYYFFCENCYNIRKKENKIYIP